MEVYLNTARHFTVPMPVADNLLGIASHDQLKVLLYVLAHHDEHLTDTDIAKACKVRVDAVEEAIVFWQSVNILQNHAEPTICHVSAQAQADASETVKTADIPSEPKSEQPEPPAAPPSELLQKNSSSYHLLPTEIVERQQANPTLASMLAETERLVGHLLSHTELRSIIWMHEYLGLGLDLIYMIIAYLVKNLCYNVREAESIAVKWHEAGIQTHEAAVADIERRSLSRSYTGRIMRIFEMSRRPTPKQQAYIDGWQKVGISPELVEYAYQISRDKNNDKLDFRYINGILKKWYEAKIHTVAEAESADAAYYESKRKQQTEQAGVQNPANPQKSARKGTYNPQEHSYDLTEIENLMKKI